MAMTRVCWIAARAGTVCSVNLTARAFHSSTTLLAIAGGRGVGSFGGTFVLAPVVQTAPRNGQTDVRESATTRLKVNTNPLFNVLLLMFSSFCSGFVIR